MTIFDLVFLASLFLVIALLGSILVSALRGRFGTTLRLSIVLGIFVAIYGAALVSTALATPRRVYPPNHRRCWDDWCIAAIDIKQTGSPCGPQTWLAAFEVSSDAKRVRQRARDAHAELEDQQGRRYAPCAYSEQNLYDEVGPGESFRVTLPFQLPPDGRPAGAVIFHGAFPGNLIIADDASVFHTPALFRLE